MITVVCFLWRTPGNVPPRYTAEHVNRLLAMLARHLRIPHRLVCATDNAAGLHSDIAIVRIDPALVAQVPARYLKLALFRPDAAQLFGGTRLMMIDLDVVTVDDVMPLAQRIEDFVIWRDPLAIKDEFRQTHRYNSSLILMNAGCRPQVWTGFDANTSIDKVKASRLVGSDQAWIGMTLGPDEATFTQTDGVLGWKHDLDKGRSWPDGARMIFNHGRPKAWELEPDHPLRIAYEQYGEKAAA